jgi:hypothetical protein
VLTVRVWPGLLQDLQLHQFVSQESGLDEASAGGYELFAVSNHYGNLVGGHYTAVCRAPATPQTPAAEHPQPQQQQPPPPKEAAAAAPAGAGKDGAKRGAKELWYSCNDEAVTPLSAARVASPCAYILCYHRRDT